MAFGLVFFAVIHQHLGCICGFTCERVVGVGGTRPPGLLFPAP